MRNKEIDFLRFVGLALIILAHVGPHPLIFQIRNFDVPLMVMIAGISFGLSYREEGYRAYLWKRINRLVFPVWIFLSIYFFLLFSTGFPAQLPSFQIIASSYLLLGGIGYVWIIRVFLLVAMVAPLIWKINDRTCSSTRYLSVCGVSYLAYESLIFLTKPIGDSYVGKALESTLLYLIPYSLVFAVGLRLPSMARLQIGKLCLGAFVIFLLIGVALYLEAGKFVPTQNFKYPPTAYYLSFALAGSTLLWLSANRLLSAIKSSMLLEMIDFIAQNSIWIYLWHIPMVEIVNFGFFIKYPLVFVLAATVTFVQVICVKRYVLPRVKSVATKKHLQTLFTG